MFKRKKKTEPRDEPRQQAEARASRSSTFRNITVVGNGRDGIRIGSGHDVKIGNALVDGNRGAAIESAPGASISISGSYFRGSPDRVRIAPLPPRQCSVCGEAFEDGFMADLHDGVWRVWHPLRCGPGLGGAK